MLRCDFERAHLEKVSDKSEPHQKVRSRSNELRLNPLTCATLTYNSINGRVEVAALEVIDMGSNQRARGLSLSIEEAGERGREATVFADYEELAGLMEGLGSMSRLDGGETQLTNFEVSYRTKGDLIVSVFSTRSGIVRCVVSGGPYTPAAVSFPAEEVGNLRSLIATAKNRLDEARPK